MAVVFQTLCSSSDGNCVRVTHAGVTLLVDCGYRAMWACEEAVAKIPGKLVGVLASHSHGDHIGYPPIRVLSRRGVTVWGHAKVLEQVQARLRPSQFKRSPLLKAFPGDRFHVEGFDIQAIEVPHAPGVPNFGFVIEVGEGEGRRKIVHCTDLMDGRPLLPHVADADLIYIESNHDLELLRLFPNPASAYHLSNPATGEFVGQLLRASRRPPKAIVLGHLSEERNRSELALEAVRGVIPRTRPEWAEAIAVHAAPLWEPSAEIRLA